MSRISPMVRTALFVADLERAVGFYRDVLGLDEVFFDGDLSDGNANELLGMPPGTTTRATILKAPGPAWGMVGLFEISEPAPAPLVRRLDTINAGEACLVFYCSDLDTVTRGLEAGGHQVLCAPVRLRIGAQVKQREMCFRDPDGTLINLIEWDPDDPRRPEQQ
jgi:catechol 2,3-dioxygenase-like lactoylglutathione lyase family enzyme